MLNFGAMSMSPSPNHLPPPGPLPPTLERLHQFQIPNSINGSQSIYKLLVFSLFLWLKLLPSLRLSSTRPKQSGIASLTTSASSKSCSSLNFKKAINDYLRHAKSIVYSLVAINKPVCDDDLGLATQHVIGPDYVMLRNALTQHPTLPNFTKLRTRILFFNAHQTCPSKNGSATSLFNSNSFSHDNCPHTGQNFNSGDRSDTCSKRGQSFQPQFQQDGFQ